MMRYLMIILLGLAFATGAHAQDADEAPPEVEESATEEQAEEENGNGVSSPKTMSGMSILGNEETPKSLVIVPWKSSEMGDELSLSDTLDDRARPVDKEVFLRELDFYRIRAGRE